MSGLSGLSLLLLTGSSSKLPNCYLLAVEQRAAEPKTTDKNRAVQSAGGERDP